ncbi:MAG TPA: hypothetical protein VFH60_09410 [Chloroflexia bacterium]|nr:hypothetical protein [Chloroflexia bacterium]
MRASENPAKRATGEAQRQTVSRSHRARLVLFALLSAFFSFGCITWTTVVEVTRSEDGKQHSIGTSIRYEFDKGVWAELEADERDSTSDFADPLKEQGWKVETSDGGRIINITRDPAPLDTLKEQGWTVIEQPLETGRIVTATLPFLGAGGTKSDDPAKEPVQNITVVIDESDPSATRYTYRSKVFVDISEQASDSGSSPPPASEDSWGDFIQDAIDQSPDVQRLEEALKNAGPPKLIIGAALPGIIESSTINGEPGGTPGGNSVEWTIDTQKAGTYNLEAKALGAQMELAITQFEIEGTEVTTPDGTAFSISDTLKVNLRVAGQNKDTKDQDFEKFNPIGVKLYYDDKEIDAGQTGEGGNVSFSFTPPADAPAGDAPAGEASEGVSSHTIKVVASKKGFEDAEESKTIEVSSGKKKEGLDLTVDHIEVVQVIQTKDNKIPLVAGKKTVVRVFLKGTGDPSGVISNVRGSIFVWPEGKSEVEVKSAANGSINVINDAEPRRDDTNASLNFVIPRELTGPGVFSIKAVVNPTHGIKESDFDNNELTEAFEFVQRNGLRVGFVRIGYKPPGQTVWAWPGTNIPNYGQMMSKLFPAADGAVQYYELPFRIRQKRLIDSDDAGEELNWSLREFYDRMQGDKPDIMIGWLPNEYASTFPFGGLAETVLSGQVARVALAVDHRTDYSSMHVLPHEVGHNLGLDHTGTRSDSSSDCRLSVNRGSGYWPGEYGDSAAIRDSGFDTSDMRAIPGTFYDLMAYCNEHKTWLSTYHYKKLFDYNLRPQGYFDTTRAHKVWVRGWASLRGDAAFIEFVAPGTDSGGGTSSQALGTSPGRAYGPGLATNFFLPLTAGKMAVAGQVAQREGEGDHCLRFLDAADALQYERCFDLTFQSAETLEPLEGSGFVLGVPDPGNVARVTLVRNDGGSEQELTSLEVSANAPTLTITSPKAGDNWAGEHTIEWSGSDRDGDTLRYDIQYSPDAKKSWYPLEVGSHDTAYTFSTDEILPSDQTYIRVTASDGFNTTSADVGPLVIPQQPNSPNPPPAPGVPSTDAPAASASSPLGGLPGWGLMAIIGGGVAALVLVLGMVMFRGRSSRRQAVAYPSGAGVAPPTYPQARVAPPPPTATAQPYYPPAAPPTQPLQPQPGPTPFHVARLEHARLQGELAAGRINHQQYEAAVNAIRVQDQSGRFWMLGAYDGFWYYYDGRSWVRTNL